MYSYLFLERITELDDGLSLAKALGKSCLALLTPSRSAGLNLLKAR
jgi:hypothetical protein